MKQHCCPVRVDRSCPVVFGLHSIICGTCIWLLVNSPLSVSCCRWWSMSMLTAWRSATLSLWTRTALYGPLCGTPATTPSCQTHTTGQVSASAPRPTRSRTDPHCVSMSPFLCFPLNSQSQIFRDHANICLWKKAGEVPCYCICSKSVFLDLWKGRVKVAFEWTQLIFTSRPSSLSPLHHTWTCTAPGGPPGGGKRAVFYCWDTF